MKVLIAALLCSCLGAFAQYAPPKVTPPPLPDIPDETVIAVFDDGTPFTMQDYKLTKGGLPQANQQMADLDRKAFVEWWASFRKLAQLAEKQKLDQQTPTKERLAFDRTMLMADAMMNAQLTATTVAEEDVAKFYEANRDRFKRVRVKAIYIAFGQNPPEGKKALKEEDARQKAVNLLAQIRGGTDFIKLVKDNSDDVASRQKDGDFGAIGANDALPDAIRKTVAALKKGEVSEPVRQPSGFYLLRAEDVEYTPLAQAHNEIWVELRQQLFTKWQADIKGSVKVAFPVPVFVNGAPAATPAGK
jgi:parvulin-like peptidyl-prolyl isomerase